MSVAGEVEDATPINALNDTIPRDDAPTEATTDTQDTVHTHLDTPKDTQDAQDAVTVADVTKDTTEVLVDDEAPDAPTQELDTKDSADTLVDVAVSSFIVFC